ncbi:phenylalanine--tRNA ligase subunit beta [[Mycoplasma] mobile]|uniref:Phenylalanine--tRNA ligase beta subunit n=1 Tax=Mycoplasma mobile (strain ATCC 43663 / 163K / NCTC 11711) TaxID=267748 RepID=SYFB_MYCM1|nr:phenylalanine--tRNA ligase subunit beta [[Mycoplasma] mobile]Q6KHC8.1 RecName: Full=Phenylalanine--tRNA ligase beta subunit; AltName: Full=Phenylalanyl-tRNA synthetase beta subunit; Short=PheRS [Mycoplasma mobile 163K]AAT28002.1 phenylalanyl-tRNA synthetase beta chain [Mycoplasma mobile 163K]
MIFSYKHLKKLANLNEISFEDVIKAFNLIGFEVEETKEIRHVENIKYGKVLKIYKNENSDNLTVCEIQFKDKIRIIQTTAKNVEINKYVMAFIPGSKLANNLIESKLLKGIISEGMLVGFDEMLGFEIKLVPKELSKNVIVLDEANLNEDPIANLELHDYLIDLAILPNRSDAISYLVMAKELAAFFGTKIDNDLICLKNLRVSKINSNLEGIFVKSKTLELKLYDKYLLLKSHLKLTNTYKDLENLILIHTGMPIHFLNLKSLEKVNIVSKSSSLEIANRTLKIDNNLVIEKSREIIAIPYLETQKEFEIKDSQKEFFIFMNILSPKEVRKTIKTLKLESSQIKQATKTISHGMQLNAIQYMQSLFEEIEIVNINLNLKPKEILFDHTFINRIAGFEIVKEQKFINAKKSLEILGFKFFEDKILVPAYRHDYTGPYDVIEELFRFYGYDNFPILQPEIKPFKIQKKYDFKFSLASKNYNEIKTYSLVAKEDNNFDPFNFKTEILMKTFPSEKRRIIRNSQAFSLLEIAEYNIKRKLEKINFFDFGMINEGKRALIFASNEKSFNEIKKDLFSLFSYKFELRKTKNNYLHPNASAHIFYENKLIGWMGKINPSLKISDLIFVEILLDEFNISKNQFKEYNFDPLKFRDITFSIEKNQSIDTYLKELKKIKNIFEVQIIDKFEKNEKLNITVRILLEDDAIKNLDEAILKNSWN